jgi:arylsulfatase A-like enzyme
MSDKPNVLWIIADQLRADHLGFGGNAIVRTPNLDALAARGTVFDRAYVTNPICMPNRCTMLTGRVPSAHGVIFNDRSLAWGSNTFVRQLADAGYDTALIGKSHIQHGMSQNVVREMRAAPTLADPYPRGWDSLENPDRYADGSPDTGDFYGFKHAEFAIGHGDMVTGHHYRWALEKGATPEDLLTGEPYPDSPANARYPGWWQVYQPTLPEELYSTAFIEERTIAWLEEAAGGETPWCMECSFPDPHHPFTPPGRWWDAYSADDMPEPATFDDPLTDAPKHLHLIRSLDPGENYVQMFGANRELVRHAMAAEFGMIEMMDGAIGRILGALERLGIAEDTVIVFTSDHGDMFGDHGLMLKATMHYQGCLRVPLVIARPGAEGTRSQALASTLDFANTILDLCDVPGFVDMQGISLAPLLDDPQASVRDHALVEEDFPLARPGGPMPQRTRSIVTAEHRYTRYSTGDVELFDLVRDPDELVNLAATGGADALCGEMAGRLADALTASSSMAQLG